MHPRSVLVVVASLLAGCDAGKTVDDAAKATKTSVDQAKTKIDDAGKAAGKSLDDAKNLANKTTDDAKSLASKTTDDVKRFADSTTLAAKKAWAGITDTGELSSDAAAWMKERATVDGAKVEKVIDKGVQVAPVALEIALVVNAAVDDDTAIEPIYTKIEGEQSEAEVDAAIAGMSRVEVLDGVKVGYSQLSKMDASTKVDEEAYLITWRREDRLIGLVYRSKRTIDLDMIVKETPRLIELTKKALADQ
jgi:hypothetical protein